MKFEHTDCVRPPSPTEGGGTVAGDFYQFTLTADKMAMDPLMHFVPKPVYLREGSPVKRFVLSVLAVCLWLTGTTMLKAVSLDTWTSQNSGTTNYLFGIAYANNTFVATGTNGTILTSPDGFEWTAPNSKTTNDLNAITYANGTFVAAGGNGTILTSVDGTNWTNQTSGFASTFHAITYANGLFLAVGFGGAVMASTDGVTWTNRVSGITNSLHAVGYANGTFVVAGFRGALATSPDAVTWTPRNSGVTATLYSIAYGNAAFLATGSRGTIIASPDGVVWGGRNSGSTNSLRSAIYLNGTFLVAGFRGTIVSSTDGILWTKRNSGSTNALRGIAYGMSNLVVAGHRGTILQSGTSPLLPNIIRPPQSQTVIAGGSVMFGVTVSGTTPLSYQWRFNEVILPGKTTSTLTLSRVRWTQAGNYSVVISNVAGVAVSLPATLTVTDTTKPFVVISSPAAGARLTNAGVTIQGAVTDADGVARVEFRLGSNPFAVADGTTNWSATLTLSPGTNILTVKAVDLAGNESFPISRSFIYVTLSPLTVQTNGNGTVTPNLSGQLLVVGRSYTLTAVPGVGFFFSNWTGGLVASAPALSFLMQSNLVLQANFVLNPFIAVKGIYPGLFYEISGVLHESSGSFTAITTDRGTFTAQMQLAGKRLAWSGRFNLEGKATNRVARPGTNALTVELQIGLADNPDQMTGRISDGIWEAELLTDRAWSSITTNRSPHAGRYTLAIPGTNDATMGPEGNGWGTVTIDARGNVAFIGMLGDGTRVVQRVPLSKRGQWPLYVALYARHGSILSWTTFADTSSNSLTGRLSWIKPTLPLTRYYPGGFTNDQIQLVGSLYVVPATTNRVLSITNAVVVLAGGNLSQPFTNNVVLSMNNKVTNTSSNSLVLAIALPTGLFTGTAVEPGTGKTILLRGALLQKQNLGCGFFLGANQSGRVTFRPGSLMRRW